MNKQISQIVETIIQSGYTQINDLEFEKHSKAYTILLKLQLLPGNNTIHLYLARKYNNDDKLYIIFDQKRRIGKLVNCIGGLLKSQKYHSIHDDNFIHVEVHYYLDFFLFDSTHDDDYDKIDIDNFDHIEGLVDIHRVEHGRCFLMLNRQSANNFCEIIKHELEQQTGIQIKSVRKDDLSYDKIIAIDCILQSK